MSRPDPTDERPPGVKRGAFPSPRSDIDSAPRFKPDPGDPDSTDTEDDSPDRDTDEDTTTSAPASGPDQPS